MPATLIDLVLRLYCKAVNLARFLTITISNGLAYYLLTCRIKEEPSEIHFPELDEIDEVNEAEQLLNLESKVLCPN